MNHQQICILCLMLLTVCLLGNSFSPLKAQERDSATKLPKIFSTGIAAHRGFIFAHSPEVENTKGANPIGIELNASWQRSDKSAWDLCNCYPRSGLALSYYDYDTKILGEGISAAYFLEPNYRVGKRSFFTIKGMAGLAYLTNPFDSIKNPTNMSYSSAISGYVLVGVGLSFRLSDHWWLNGSANYQHVSNAGLSQPNKGINWPTLGIEVRYQKDKREYYAGPRSKDKSWKNNPPRYDIILFGMSKKGSDEHGNRKRMPLIGLGFQAAKQVGRINNLTLGTEIFYDESLRMQLKRDSVDASAVKAGILFGHEFILGKFLFTQRLGVYVFDQTPYYDQLFHRWGIQYRMNKNWGVGINLLAHLQVADYIDVRMIYTF